MTVAASYEEQLRFLGIGKEELELMRAEKDIFAKEAGAVVKTFYNHLAEYLYLGNLISSNSTIERLSHGVLARIQQQKGQ